MDTLLPRVELSDEGFSCHPSNKVRLDFMQSSRLQTVSRNDDTGLIYCATTI